VALGVLLIMPHHVYNIVVGPVFIGTQCIAISVMHLAVFTSEG